MLRSNDWKLCNIHEGTSYSEGSECPWCARKNLKDLKEENKELKEENKKLKDQLKGDSY